MKTEQKKNRLKELAESIEIVSSKIQDAEIEINLLKNIKNMLEIDVENSLYDNYTE